MPKGNDIGGMQGGGMQNPAGGYGGINIMPGEPSITAGQSPIFPGLDKLFGGRFNKIFQGMQNVNKPNTFGVQGGSMDLYKPQVQRPNNSFMQNPYGQ